MSLLVCLGAGAACVLVGMGIRRAYEDITSSVWWRTTREGSVVPLALRSAAPEGSCFPAPALLVAPAPVAEPSWPPLNHGHGPTEEERLRALEPGHESYDAQAHQAVASAKQMAERTGDYSVVLQARVEEELAKPLTAEQQRLIGGWAEQVAILTFLLNKK